MARPQNSADFAPSFVSTASKSFLDINTNSNIINRGLKTRSNGFMDKSYDQFQKDLTRPKSYLFFVIADPSKVI